MSKIIEHPLFWRGPADDMGVCAVVMNGLEIFGADRKPRDVVILQQTGGDVPDDIFHELGVLVAFLGNLFFIHAFEDRIDVAGGARFHQLNHVFEPDEALEPGLQLDFPPLVMGAVVADLLGTRTNRGYRHIDLGHQIDLVPGVAGSHDSATVVHQPGCGAHGCSFFNEVGKRDLDMRGSCIEVPLHLLQKLGKLLEGNLCFEQMEHLHESAHMGALIFMRQIDVHVDGSNGMLPPFSAVTHGNGITQILDTHLVDWDIPCITLVLDIFHGHRFRMFALQASLQEGPGEL
jgi:hypothetical protein